MLENKIENTRRNRKYIDELPRVYVIIADTYDIVEFPLVAWNKDGYDMVPYVYVLNKKTKGEKEYYDLMDIRKAMKNRILMWTIYKHTVQDIASALLMRKNKSDVLQNLLAKTKKI